MLVRLHCFIGRQREASNRYSQKYLTTTTCARSKRFPLQHQLIDLKAEKPANPKREVEIAAALSFPSTLQSPLSSLPYLYIHCHNVQPS